MIVRFFNRCLTGFDAVLGVDSAVTAPSRIDLGAIQPVYDLSRQAEAAQGFPYALTIEIATGGATVPVFGNLSPLPVANLDDLVVRGLELGELDVWLMGLSFDIAAADLVASLSFSGLGVSTPNAAGVLEQILLASFLPTAPSMPLVTAGRKSIMQGTSARDAVAYIKLPMKLPRGSLLLATVVDSGAVLTSAASRFRLWAAPVGTFPPGA